jgi:protein gp37
MARSRLTGHPDYEGVSSEHTLTGWSGQVNCCDVHIPNGNPQVFALNWMGELFNPAVSFDHIDKMFTKMMLRRQHTFLLLTKVPERLHEYMRRLDPVPSAVEHIWFGVSASTQREWDRNVKRLLKVPAVTHRWVSLEPMIEPVKILDLHRNLMEACREVRQGRYIDWVAMGAESGPNARPMKLSWAVQVIEDSAAVGMKVFYKQGPDEHGATFTKAPEVLRRSWLDVPFCQQQRGEMK